jgi:replicative DNA helicase
VPSTHSREATNGTASHADERPRLVRLATLLEEWQLDAEAAHLAFTTGAPRGPITSLPSLDRELGGALAPGVHVLHAGPGVGKTAFALQVAAVSPFPALYLSAEMGALELFRRVTARVTSTYLGRLRSGEIEPQASLALARRAAAEAPLLTIADATQAWAPPEWIMSTAQLVQGDAAGSRKFEYGGESVLSLSRDKDAAGDAAGDAPVTLLIEKNRNGAPGKKIKLLFNGALQRFREASP